MNNNCKFIVKTDNNKLKLIVIIETLNQGDDEDKCIKISLSKVNENKHILNIY